MRQGKNVRLDRSISTRDGFHNAPIPAKLAATLADAFFPA